MSATAIICEYNPLTNGHLRHIDSARRETNCDTLVCVMSGSFTQRGEPAVIEKYKRAESAVRAGADIVVELPFAYAVSYADNFAYGAIKTLSAFPNVDTLSFGSECGDAELLKRAAAFVNDEPTEYKILLKKYLGEGYAYPKALSLALKEFSETTDANDLSDVFDAPNNMLAISYISAASSLVPSLRFHTVKRSGNFHSDKLDCEFPSASAVRKALQNNADFSGAVPSYTFDLLSRGSLPSESWKDFVLFKINSMSAEKLENIYDVGEGIQNRLKFAASRASTFEEFLSMAKTKRYTLAKLKRLSIYILFDITKDLYSEILAEKPYLQILALKKERKDILKTLGREQAPFFCNYEGELSNSRRLDKTAHEILSFLLKEKERRYHMSLV